MFSQIEIGAIILCVCIFLRLGGLGVQAGARWFGLTLVWWEGMLSFLAILALISMMIRVVRFPHERAAERRQNAEAAKREQMKAQLELRNPEARVTPLSSGHWLLTDIASGRTIREVAPHDLDLSD